MGAGEDEVRVALQRPAFGEREREAVAAKGLTASLFRFDTGVDAIRLSNARGNVVVLPYMGQMVWSAAFDGVPLEMQSMFPAPRPAETIRDLWLPRLSCRTVAQRRPRRRRQSRFARRGALRGHG